MDPVAYLNGIRQSSKDSKDLLIEASNLYNLLISLRFRVEEAQKGDPWFQQIRLLNVEGGPLDQFREILEDLVKKTDADAKRHRLEHALLWKFTKDEIMEAMNHIERLKSLVSLALANDHFVLSQTIHHDILNIQEKVIRIQMECDENEIQKISQWLRVPDPSVNYNAALRKRQQGTGLWLANDSQYEEWKTAPGKPMWLHAGCGKTVLSASVISDLKSVFEADGNSPLAFFYFDFGDNTKQTPRSFMRSIFFQLSFQVPNGAQIIQQQYKDHGNGGSEMSDCAVEACISLILNTAEDVFIVIDALDECSDREELLGLIQSLVGSNSECLHLLMTSRREYDISEQLLRIVSFNIDIQSNLIKDDIHLYIQEYLSNDIKLRKWSDFAKEMVMECLTAKANGMFRWVYCQLDALRKCITPKNIRKALSSLPVTLDETYDRILKRIEEEGHLEDAITILQCICFAKRPLHVIEIVEILAVDFGNGFSDEERLSSPEQITAICSSLVSIGSKRVNIKLGSSDFDTLFKDIFFIPKEDPNFFVVRLGHYSVQEYLTSNRNRHSRHFTPEAGSAKLAQVCMIYFTDFWKDTLLVKDTLGDMPITEYPYEELLQTIKRHRPFMEYAATEWWGHLSMLENNLPTYIFRLGMKLFEEQFLRPWTRMDKQITPSNSKYETVPSAIYSACFIGLSQIANELIKQGSNIHTERGPLGSALYAASYRGHTKIVQRLINSGADPNEVSRDDRSTALEIASAKGYREVVQALVDGGADMNIGSKSYGPPLSAAALHGHEGIVKYFLNYGADVNRRGGMYCTALQSACYGGRFKLAKILLDHGANVTAKGGRYRTALNAACSTGDKDLVQMLLARGADPNIPGGPFFTGLFEACIRGHKEVAQILLDHGADPNIQRDKRSNLLSRAVGRGDKDLVRMLLDHGADVPTDIGGKYITSIFYLASNYSNPEVLEMILSHKANMDVRSVYHGDDPQELSRRRRERIAQIRAEEGLPSENASQDD